MDRDGMMHRGLANTPAEAAAQVALHHAPGPRVLLSQRGEPWLPEEAAIHAIHTVALLARGGAPGVLQSNAIRSALARPNNLLAYGAETADLFDVAASLTCGLARNHPFLDGNKRMAYFTGYAMLWHNGVHLALSEADAVHLMRELAEAGRPIEQCDMRCAQVMRGFAQWRTPNVPNASPLHYALAPDGSIRSVASRQRFTP